MITSLSSPFRFSFVGSAPFRFHCELINGEIFRQTIPSLKIIISSCLCLWYHVWIDKLTVYYWNTMIISTLTAINCHLYIIEIPWSYWHQLPWLPSPCSQVTNGRSWSRESLTHIENTLKAAEVLIIIVAKVVIDLSSKTWIWSMIDKTSIICDQQWLILISWYCKSDFHHIDPKEQNCQRVFSTKCMKRTKVERRSALL